MNDFYSVFIFQSLILIIYLIWLDYLKEKTKYAWWIINLTFIPVGLLISYVFEKTITTGLILAAITYIFFAIAIGGYDKILMRVKT